VADETEKEKQAKVDAAELMFQLMKEHTQALMENTKALRGVVLQIIGVAPDDKNPGGLIGLMDRLGDLGEAVDELDTHIVGQNVMLARINFVFDRMVDIATGDEEKPELTEGQEPEPGKVYKKARIPIFRDLSAILLDYDKELEEEAKRDSEAEQKEIEEEDRGGAPPAPPAKPSMMTNGTAAKPHPRLKALPPLPVSAPLPPK
jgi:hypothetical protein